MRRYIVLALWLAMPLAAHGAELGKLTVLSLLGQPLNAEIQVGSLVAGEDDNLVARLASPEAFSKAGIAFNPALANLRFAMERRGDGAVLHVTSAQPMNEPFLDVLVEIQRGTSRIVRQYTFLLDPPNYGGQPVVAAAPVEKPAEAPAPSAAPLEARTPEAAPAPEVAAEPAPAAAPAAPASPFAYKVEVQKGETLSSIAKQYLPDGMTLNQMLVAIYRANPDAFIHKNVNLVRAGRILTIPGNVVDVDAKEANRVIHEHIAEFAEYRRQLAAAPAAAAAESGGQAASGRIEPAPQALPPAATQDQLRLSKAEPGKPGGAASRAARQDDRAALARAIDEEESRARELTKNVADLQKLIALKDKQIAEVQKSAPPPAAAVPAVAKAPNATAEKGAPPAAKAATPPAEKKPLALKKAAPAPAPQEAGILDEFLNSPLNLGLLGLVLVLLIGYGWWTWRKKKGAGGLSFHLGR